MSRRRRGRRRAVGFVCFAGSPRFVPADALAALARLVPAYVTPVLLFVDAHLRSPGGDRGCTNALLQFHGAESPSNVPRFRRPYVKAFGMSGARRFVRLRDAYSPPAAALPCRTPSASHGGSGRVFDWTPSRARAATHAARARPVDSTSTMSARRFAGSPLCSRCQQRCRDRQRREERRQDHRFIAAVPCRRG